MNVKRFLWSLMKTPKEERIKFPKKMILASPSRASARSFIIKLKREFREHYIDSPLITGGPSIKTGGMNHLDNHLLDASAYVRRPVEIKVIDDRKDHS